MDRELASEDRDTTVEPFIPMNADTPGYYDESSYDYALYGEDE